MKRVTIGIVAHVDAGKTTCIEDILFRAGVIRKKGRVDHADTVMDYDEQEKGHGITIYSKEAHYIQNNTEVFLIDTPGHVDFSQEMERALRALDIAILLINGQDGVQSHTETIWHCLEHYGIPTLLFVNKMDISHRTEEELLADIQKSFSTQVIRWDDAEKEEHLAMLSDRALEVYSEEGTVPFEEVQHAFYERRLFPLLFGSALKDQGVADLMTLVEEFAEEKEYPEAFGAFVYQISQDDKGNRLTHIKVTGGSIAPKETLREDEKIDQIRIYNGLSYEMVQNAEAGMVVALKGPKTLQVGDGLGFEEDRDSPLLNAFMDYELVIPHGANALVVADVAREIAEEDPVLDIRIDEKTKKIQVHIMGEMQMEVLQKKIFDRSGIQVGFSTGKIVYQETIAEPVQGAGHFEPLRHYAEVHVRLTPLASGSGIEIASSVSSDVLSTTWQNTILSVLRRMRMKGVLTGSELTDVKIELIAGKGHIKHTEGGDFRQAAQRAVRQALRKANNVLLEPFYEFTLKLPSDFLSRAMYDLESRSAKIEVQDVEDGNMVIHGTGPVRTLLNYQNDVIAYTKGRGRFSAVLSGYYPSLDQDKLVEEIGYDPDMDLRYPADSVFCANGSGYTVPWDQSDEHMHIQWKEESTSSYAPVKFRVGNDDLASILEQSGGKNRNTDKMNAEKRQKEKEKKEEEKHRLEKQKVKAQPILEQMMIVDGYNMIYAWDSLKKIAYEDLSSARDKLIEYLFNYLPYYDGKITVVFDGYLVKDNIGSSYTRKDLSVVYTKSGETADAYMERSSYELKGKYKVTYATSDGLIQNAVFSQGGLRMSARELESQLKYHHVIY